MSWNPARHSPLERPLVLAVLAISIALAGCLDGAGGQIAEPNAGGAPEDEPVPEGPKPALTVYEMSGELPHTSVGLDNSGNDLKEVGSVPLGADYKGTILIDFQPDLGPAADEVSICIGTFISQSSIPDCEVWMFSSDQAVQLDATGLSGKTILVGTSEGAGTGTTYVLCASVFDFHRARADYTAIVDGRCNHTVVDMSGEIPDTSVGIFALGNTFEAGTVPSGDDDEATILIDFWPDLGLAAMSVAICIGTQNVGLVECEASEYSTGDAVQLDATGLSGKTIFIRTDYGAGTGTTYVLCASLFDVDEPSNDYTAIVDGRCHGIIASDDGEAAAR